MNHNKSRGGILVGLAAATGGFAAAAAMTAATAPTAHADDFSDVVSAVEADFALGQADFTAAEADFGSSSTVPDGLALFFNGVDMDLVAPSDSVALDTVEALAGDTPQSTAFTISFGPPTDLADALTGASDDVQAGAGALSDAATYFSDGEYALATDYALIAPLLADVEAPEILLIGGIESLGF
jgi:hypothetical protein